jgi:3-oxoadipate enol-lactonase
MPPSLTPGSGVRLACRDLEVAIGEWGRGAPLMLVHGLGEDHRAWRKLLPHLALSRRVIAYDLRGHGETTLGDADGTLAQLGDDLVALLDAMGLGRVDLCGFSLGGMVVLRAAIDAPRRVRRLVPLATSSRVGRAVAPWYLERAELADRGAQALHPVLEEDTRQQFLNAPGEADAHWRIRRQATQDPRGFANACRAAVALNAAPLDPELPGIRAPTLVVSGELDSLCPPRAGEIVASAIPGARLEIVPGSGHAVAVERPSELGELLLGFLDDGDVDER